ncbi:flagellar hook-length control protein FliK [Massilia aurea]|uniref:flagellar hook-length control protein FliK n=1 Tax=Massilia aurea TaxID=373040 RepID=UPI0021624516|nr:flagellar hook-length control protein FliK [Massilia aurea]MCS0706822.1 flagellar hook-length control protein FliK [Massilia aurea]
MTMQTNTLPFQITGANATTQRPATPDRLADAARSSGTGGFSATLNREMATRQPVAPPQPAAQPKPAQGQKPAAPDKPANRDPVRDGPTRSTIRPPMHDGDAKSTQAASSSTADAASDADDAAAAEAAAAAAAATTPVTDMLAFMASLSQPASNATTVSTDAAAAGAATESDAQLTALETALDNMKGMATGATDDTDAASGKGQALASGVQQTSTDLRTTQAAGAALPQGEQDVGQFQAQLRETQQQQLPVAEEAPAPLAALQAQAAKLDATGNPAMPGDRIPARLGTQAWDNQVSQRIVYMVGKEQAATLTLNPPDLGPVQIVLNVTNDQATVAFSSDQLDVRQALENALPRLREMMSESGIALGNATVDANVPDGRQQQQDSERRAQGGQRGAGGLTGDGQDAAPAVNEVAPRTRTVSLGDRGMVDLFA